MPTRPLIGLTIDMQHPHQGNYAKYPWYSLRRNYCAAVTAASGIPFLLPYHEELVPAYLEKMDALVVTGGNFDIPPLLFGDKFVHEKTVTNPERSHFEAHIIRKAYDHGKPILGICGGMQLLNVVLGGTLIQHIPDEIPDTLLHEQENPHTEASHDVIIEQGTLLYKLAHQPVIAVNSSHHQAIKRLGSSLIINAVAPDGIIEGIEDPTRPFCLGVQWHPEYSIQQTDLALFSALVRAAQEVR